jgi:hypothetical protein
MHMLRCTVQSVHTAIVQDWIPEAESKEKTCMVYVEVEPYAAVDYNLTIYLLQSRLQYMYHRQPYASVDLNPMP